MTSTANDNLVTHRDTFVSHLECSMTGERYAPDQLLGLSSAGWPLLVRYDLDGVRKAMSASALAARPRDLWRYRELLPVRRTGNIVSLGENETPLIPLTNVADDLGAGEVLVKDESRLPTGSFKARGMALAISMAKELGVTRMALPTNGNAGAALAAYGSRAGIESIILLPDDTPDLIVREIGAFGARVYKVDGYVDDCAAIIGKGAKEGLWFDLSTLKEPYRIEGKKTMGLELADQLGWSLPDVIFYPAGGGTGFIGMWKAFQELEDIGLIGSHRPRMVAVQAAGCAPIVKAWEDGLEHAPRWEDAHTIATGIRVPKALGDFLMLRAVRESGGFALAVPDENSVEAMQHAASRDGVMMCPEGGATLAAYKMALDRKLVDPGERAVLFNTATGLKYPMGDTAKTLKRAGPIDLASL